MPDSKKEADMARIWMNHWFSTAYSIIKLIRDAVPDIEIIGSNERPYSPIMNVCDEWYQEPELKGEQYVSYCLDFCREHGIDLFMPRRGMVLISQYKDRFTDAGIKVMADDHRYVSLCSIKSMKPTIFSGSMVSVRSRTSV